MKQIVDMEIWEIWVNLEKISSKIFIVGKKKSKDNNMFKLVYLKQIL